MTRRAKKLARHNIESAIGELNAVTNVNIFPVNVIDTQNYDSILLFRYQHGARRCKANLGEGSVIRCDSSWRVSTLVHEIGHALGLLHEHQRPDRDEHLIVPRPDVYPIINHPEAWYGKRYSYDRNSVMHYPRQHTPKGNPRMLILSSRSLGRRKNAIGPKKHIQQTINGVASVSSWISPCDKLIVNRYYR